MNRILNILLLVSVLLVGAGLSGCATTKEVKALEGEVQKALDQSAAALAAANDAKSEAAAARAAAEKAEKAAMDAKAAIDATNQKIDNMFKKTMQK